MEGGETRVRGGWGCSGGFDDEGERVGMEVCRGFAGVFQDRSYDVGKGNRDFSTPPMS